MTNYNPYPREEFLRNKDNITGHHILVENEVLRRSLSVAMLEYQRRQSRLASADLGGCAACHLRCQGMQEFVDLFYNLAETPTSVARTESDNLASNVKTVPPPAKK